MTSLDTLDKACRRFLLFLHETLIIFFLSLDSFSDWICEGKMMLNSTIDLPTSLVFLDENLTLSLPDFILPKTTNATLGCMQIKYGHISQNTFFQFVRHVTDNLNRFFLLPALILNLCAFYIIRRTRMNRSSSIAFYMQALALCDVAFFALRVMFGELSRLSVNRHILTNGLCKFLFLMVNAVNYTTGRRMIFELIVILFSSLVDCRDEC